MVDPPIAAPRARVPALAFVLLAVGIGTAGWLYQREQQRHVERRAESELTAVAKLKVREITAWRAERLADATDLATNPLLARELARADRRSPATLSRVLKPWLDHLSGFRVYTNVALVDSLGRPVVTQHETTLPLQAEARAHVAVALSSGGPFLSDFVRDEKTGDIRLDLCAAVPRGGRPGAPAVGAVIYQVDPNQYFFPLVQSWPTSSPTAEMLLARREGDAVLFLNELRHRRNTAMALRIPLTSTQVPAVQGVLGREGVFHGTDYRGVPVISALSHVPGTPWTVVAKLDADEVMAAARESARATAAAVIALLAAAAAGVALWWRQERAAFFAQRYRDELERQKLLRRAEEALLASEERLRLTLDSIGDAVIATDAQAQVERMNPVAERLTGWQLEDARGRPLDEVFRIVHQETRHPLESPAARVLREGMVVGLANHTALISRDGGEHPIADSGAPIRDADGRIAGVVMVFRDATEERAARALAAFQTRLLETLHDAVVGLDPDMRVRTWNAAAERLYGWTAQEAVGRDSRELLGTEYPGGDEGRKEILCRLAEIGRVQLEVPQHRRDGTRLLVAIDAAALRHPEGNLAGYLLVMRDVSDRRRTEQALRASEAKFRAAFHSANLGIFLVDAEARLLECNRAFREMLGHCDEEMQRMRLCDLLHPDDLSRCRSQFREMLEGQRDLIAEERRFRRKDGGYAQGLLRASPVRGPSGEFVCSVGVVEDMTQRRVMEAQLAFADRMSSIGTLAAGVAHELNNPLAFILANVSYALGELGRPALALADITNALREARDGAERARDIVRDLKLFSRPDEERPDETVDVREALRSSIGLAQNEIRHRARLVQDLRPVPPVAAGAHRLGQVFLNLLVNAAQAIPEGQAARNEIRVATRPSEDGRVLIEVTDTGSGISPDHLSRIFEPFFTTKPVGVGTGLGLSICHGIIASLGGEIEVRSTLGEGSTFRLLLPAAQVRSSAVAEAAQSPSPAVVRGRILVVDDEPMVGRAVQRILSSAHDVECLTSAEAALSRLEQDGSFDLVLCDLMMPDMTGMELHQRLTRTAPTVSDKMIFLTGGAFTHQARDFLERVPNPRLEKPFDPQTLRALVGELLAQRRP